MRISLKHAPPGDDAAYPFSVPQIRTLPMLDVHAAVTFFVGENGSGESTLLEGIATATELPSIGSSQVVYEARYGSILVGVRCRGFHRIRHRIPERAPRADHRIRGRFVRRAHRVRRAEGQVHEWRQRLGGVVDAPVPFLRGSEWLAFCVGSLANSRGPGVIMPGGGYEGHEKILEVLRMLVSAGGVTDVRSAARALYPTSPLWKVQARVPGPGGLRECGAKLHSITGALLGRLRSRGLVERLNKGIYAITQAGRDYVAREDPKTQMAPLPQRAPMIPPHPAYAPPGTRVLVLGTDGNCYPATVVSYAGPWVFVRFENGASMWIDARVAQVA